MRVKDVELESLDLIGGQVLNDDRNDDSGALLRAGTRLVSLDEREHENNSQTIQTIKVLWKMFHHFDGRIFCQSLVIRHRLKLQATIFPALVLY